MRNNYGCDILSTSSNIKLLHHKITTLKSLHFHFLDSPESLHETSKTHSLTGNALFLSPSLSLSLSFFLSLSFLSPSPPSLSLSLSFFLSLSFSLSLSLFLSLADLWTFCSCFVLLN